MQTAEMAPLRRRNRNSTGQSIGQKRAVPPYLMSSQTSALTVVVNAQADAQRRAEAVVHSIAIHIAVTLSGKPEISTSHHNLITP
ncbi:hypothetical protein DMS04_24925 [Salmonella enterica]|nr:hypothetical protein [Salmonella enterica]